MEIRAEKKLQGGWGCAVALLIGIVTIGAVRLTLWLLYPSSSFDFRDEWGGLLFQSLIVASPFGFFALCDLGATTNWTAAFILSSVLWGLFAVGALQGGAVGANIGVGLLLMASPLGIAPGAIAINSAVRRLRRK